jgi:hypothetical protein
MSSSRWRKKGFDADELEKPHDAFQRQEERVMGHGRHEELHQVLTEMKAKYFRWRVAEGIRKIENGVLEVLLDPLQFFAERVSRRSRSEPRMRTTARSAPATHPNTVR